jgi:hypothetical protein
MPELTDSFCERCGARHVFASKGAKGLSLKRARVLAKGLKNFVLTDGQSMGDSITTARMEYDGGDSSRMTEEFHKAFNFCMTCRQYACDKCWNAEISACLSCAPQADSAPVAPEDRLIVRTPVARWDSDWLDFNDPEVDSATNGSAASSPLGWPGPLQISAPTVPPTRPGQSQRPDPTAWPAADVLEHTNTGPGPNGRNGRGGRRIAEPGASSLWPAADELAPEMTLTPEEMMLVEAELSQPETGELAAATADLDNTTAPTAPTPTVAAPTPTVAIVPTVAAPTPTMPMAPTVAAPFTFESRPPSPSRMPPTSVLPVLPAPIVPSQLQAAEPAGIMARLFGRHGPSDKVGTPDGSDSGADGVALTEPWPHPTPWAESLLSSSRWRGNGIDGAADAAAGPDAAATSTLDQPVDQAADLSVPLAKDRRADGSEEPASDHTETPALAHDVDGSVLAPAVTLDLVEPGDSAATLAGVPEEAAVGEARSAAAMRQSAARHSENLRADEVAAATRPAPTEIAARHDRDSELAEVARRKATSRPAPVRHAADAAPTGTSSPPVPWPPLGASWPAREPHRDAWPVPAAPLTAVVAAQQSQPTYELELWAQSSQEVLNRGTVRVCHHCALPVSTQARFCRRCGTQQA